MVVEQFTDEAGKPNASLTTARFLLGGGGSARNANLGTVSISRMTDGIVSTVATASVSPWDRNIAAV